MSFFLEHWQTSDGPWLILHEAGGDGTSLMQLINLLEVLADSPSGTTISLHNQDFVQAAAALDLEVTSAGAHRLRQTSDGWTWRCPAVIWHDHPDRIAPSDGRSMGGWHQYFDQHPADDAVVVLSIDEYPQRFADR